MTRSTLFFCELPVRLWKAEMGSELATLGGLLVQVEGAIREEAGKWDPGLQWSPTGADEVGLSP